MIKVVTLLSMDLRRSLWPKKDKLVILFWFSTISYPTLNIHGMLKFDHKTKRAINRLFNSSLILKRVREVEKLKQQFQKLEKISMSSFYLELLVAKVINKFSIWF